MVLGNHLAAIEVPREGVVQRAIHERRLSRPADAGDTQECAEREACIHILEIVAACATHDDLILCHQESFSD